MLSAYTGYNGHAYYGHTYYGHTYYGHTYYGSTYQDGRDAILTMALLTRMGAMLSAYKAAVEHEAC